MIHRIYLTYALLCMCSALLDYWTVKYTKRDQSVYNTICKMIAALVIITPMYLMYLIWSVGT